ncbi:MAG: serine hydrolase domain-containing protein [Acidobacteriota bacterium]
MKLTGSKSWICVTLFLTFATSARGGSRSEAVDTLFKEWDRPESPGCALGIIERGRLIYERGYGMANLEYDLPITPRSVFRIGSVSKQFTAMSILLAAGQGKLSLDDDIRKYLRELQEHEKPVTIRHLIHHTSGIRDYLTLMTLDGKRDEDFYTDAEVLESLARQQRLNFTPGDEYLYSNSGYFLLSQIILRATGKTLREFAEEHIFRPLGMDSTHFHDDFRMIVKNRASGYRPRGKGGFELDMTSLEMVGDGAVFTSVEDLSKWDRNFYDNRLGSPDLLRQMLTPGVLRGGVKQNYAFGLRVGRYRGLPTVGHGGSFVGFRAHMLRFPEQKFTVICLCNLSSIDPGELNRKVAEIYLGEHMRSEKLETLSLGPEALATRTGVYWDSSRQSLAEVKLEDGELQLTEGGSSFRLRPLSESSFRAREHGERVEVRFETSQGEGVQRMNVQYEGQRLFTFDAVPKVSPTWQELSQYEGSYVCEELGVNYGIRLGEEGTLILKVAHFPDRPLEPVFRDGFRWSMGSVLFKRDSRGEVSGFVLQAGRARNFTFVRRPGPPQGAASRDSFTVRSSSTLS